MSSSCPPSCSAASSVSGAGEASSGSLELLRGSDPQPGPSSASTDACGDPKPGPSTTAADFDLEVFDSGSSCSLEDSWGLECSPDGVIRCNDEDDDSGVTDHLHPRFSNKSVRQSCFCGSSKRRSRRERDKKKSLLSDCLKVRATSKNPATSYLAAASVDLDNSSEENEEDYLATVTTKIEPAVDLVQASSSSAMFEPASAYPSETEEAASDRDEDEDEDDEDDDEEEEHGGQHEWAQEAKGDLPSTSGADAVTLQEHLVENIDEIVQDHDNFGTDENEEDSMDSLSQSTAAADVELDDLHSIGCSKRKNLDELLEISLNNHCGGCSIGGGNHAALECMDALQPSSRKKKRTLTPDTGCWDSRAKATPHRFKAFLVASNKSQPDEALSSEHDQEHEICSHVVLVPVSQPPSTSLSSLSPKPNFDDPAAGSQGSPFHQLQPTPTPTPPPAPPPPPPSDAVINWVAMFSSWSHAERIQAIDQLISACHPTQVRHMMTVIEPQFQRDFISLLPKELALYVLSFLEPRDLLRAAQTCRYWHILAEDNLLWREKCREAGLSDVLETLNIRRKKSTFVGFNYSPWKAGFMRQHKIEMNWRFMSIRCPKVLKGHDDHVITCLQFSGNRIVSGSDDNTLKVWNATTGKCLKTLVGHTGGVWSSQMEGNVIVSGSTDRTLKVWNADSGACVHTLYGHTSTVRCMHLHENRVVSGSRDATLRMWDIVSGECLHVLMGHVAAVRCVQYDGRLVVSGAYDYMVKVWNPETEECLHTLSGHTNRVYSLQFDGIHVVSGSLDTSIRVWDVETGACKHALMGHQSLTSGMELRDNILVSGNADSTVKVWDITTGQCLQTLSGPNKHQSAVTCLQFNSKFVITSSDDGTVKLWDVRSGEFIRDLVALESGGSGGVVWRIRANATKLVCAVGSRNGTEETKLMVLDFDVQDVK